MNPFFLLLRLSLGVGRGPQRALTETEWRDVFQTAQTHAVVGLVSDAAERLPAALQPPAELRLQGYMLREAIRQRNALVNRRTVELSEQFRRDGFRSCVLKGQGVARLYPDPALRQPGDIDLWVEGARKDIYAYLQQHVAEPPEMEYHHARYPVFPDVEVEVHFIPSFLHWPPAMLALQRFYRRHAEAQFAHEVELPGGAGRVSVPTTPFNCVFSLSHIYKHFFSEGIGLRQIVDYYYILRCGLSPAERAAVCAALRSVGMWRFARAMMYVQHAVLGLPSEYLLCPPDAQEGDFVMRCIMAGGNFRRPSGPSPADEGKLHHLLRTMGDNSRLLLRYPRPVLGYPIYSLWHFLWRTAHGYK